MTNQEPTDVAEIEVDTEYVGYGPASEYLGLKRNTLSSYAARGIGPTPSFHRVVDQYNYPVFRQSELERWRASRPGQGARTDLLAVGT